MTLKDKQELRAYILRSIALPGSLVAVIMFVLGFVVDSFVKERAENKGYEFVTEFVTEDLVSYVEDVTKAVSDAEASQDRAAELVSEVESAVATADAIVERLEAAEAVHASEQLVGDVADAILEKADIAKTLSAAFERTVDLLENRVDVLEAIVLRVETGTVTLSKADVPELITGTGQRGVISRRVPFRKQFATEPEVHISIADLDIDNSANNRLTIELVDVDVDGFVYSFTTWSDTKLHRARANWIAIGPLPDGRP